MVTLKAIPKKKQKLSLKPKTEKAKKKIKTQDVKPKTVKKSEPKQHLEEKAIKPQENSSKKKNYKYILPSKYITKEIVSSCLNALKIVTDKHKDNKKIFEDESAIFAEIRCIKIQNAKGNIKFVLPHSTVASTGEVCLITPDLKKGRKPDHEPTIDHWEELLRNAGVTNVMVKTVLPMRQLRVEYDQFELKRRLMTQHDFIMVDTRVLSHVSHLLGNMFFKKHNLLIPVRINEKKDLKKCIETGLKTAMLRVNIGVTSTILVGHTGMPQKDVEDNVLALIEQLNDRYPGGEANVRAISLKLPKSLSLPLYLTLRPSSSLFAPKLKHKKPKSFQVVEGELTTIPGSKVTVNPDGTVHLKRKAVPMSDDDFSFSDTEDEDGEGEVKVASEPEQEQSE